MSDPPQIPLDPDRVERALMRLPFLEREALLMKSRDRMTYAEIGLVLGLSAAQAEAKAAAGLVRFHRLLTRRRWPWCLVPWSRYRPTRDDA